MAIKTSEAELDRKKAYYEKNKEKILERKHSRNAEIYINKVNRKMESDDEFEKEMMRKLSKLDNVNPGKCELCGVEESTLDHKLELHHFSYNETKGSFLCKPCHAEADKMRRRE